MKASLIPDHEQWTRVQDVDRNRTSVAVGNKLRGSSYRSIGGSAPRHAEVGAACHARTPISSSRSWKKDKSNLSGGILKRWQVDIDPASLGTK